MKITFRAGERLRGEKALDISTSLAAIGKATRQSPIDPRQLNYLLDWVQYRQNFRETIDVRRIQPSALDRDGDYEIAIDLRRTGSIDVEAAVVEALSGQNDSTPDNNRYLEDWKRTSESCIWSFNGLYWNALGLWEEATGKEYEEALPGGESDARNAEAARDSILELFHVWDTLAARHALPEDLHVLELGVGNGNQARVWLDEFQRLDREHTGEYYRRLHYLMGDYSPHVLERARQNVKAHSEHISTLAMDARVPSETLGFLRGKAFFIYISNTYDNLPTDEIVRIAGHLFLVESRAYIGEADAARISETYGIQPGQLPELVLRLLQLGPELLAKSVPERFPDGAMQAVGFWRDVWDATRTKERYVPIEGLDTYRIAPNAGGEILRPIVEANGDVRMHVSNGAAASFLDSLALLHPFGVLECLDIFVTNIQQYETSFRGPGKYDGSVVNWVNGPLLAAIGRRNGFDVKLEAFSRTGSNITTMTARMRE